MCSACSAAIAVLPSEISPRFTMERSSENGKLYEIKELALVGMRLAAGEVDAQDRDTAARSKSRGTNDTRRAARCRCPAVKPVSSPSSRTAHTSGSSPRARACRRALRAGARRWDSGTDARSRHCPRRPPGERTPRPDAPRSRGTPPTRPAGSRGRDRR